MRTIAENANDFADLRRRAGGDCVYVGKSLMITTFKYIFEVRRDLLLLVDAAWERE